MLDEGVVKRVLAEALAGGGDWAEVYAEDRSSTSLGLDDRRIERVSSGQDAGVGIRVVAGDRASYAYTNVFTEDALRDAATAARAGLDGAPGTILDLRRAEGTPHRVRIPPDSVDVSTKVEALKAADDAARSSGAEVRQVGCSYAEIRQRVLVASSDGVWAEDDRTRVRFSCQVVAGRDGRIGTGHEAPGISGGFELLEIRPAAEIGSIAARKALTMLDADPSPAGEFPVVLGPGGGGVLIHEACGHGLEADTLVKDASVYSGRQGERFGSDIVTIVDDGTQPNAWGSFAFDDEGTPAQNTVLFDRGVLVGHLSDRRSARKIDAPPTGNGRRQSYRSLPIVRMTNTNLLPGPDDADEIIRGIGRGIYAVAFAGGEVNPATGNFVFGMSEAYMIIGGEIAHAIRGANLIGNGPEVLSRIEAVASDLRSWDGVCGKDGQSAPVTTGMPTVLLSRMTVGGTET